MHVGGGSEPPPQRDAGVTSSRCGLRETPFGVERLIGPC